MHGGDWVLISLGVCICMISLNIDNCSHLPLCPYRPAAGKTKQDGSRPVHAARERSTDCELSAFLIESQ